jgi:hypothetical protein
MKREEKRMERVDGKAAGDHGFITCQRIGLADRERADTIPYQTRRAVSEITGPLNRMA